MYDQGTLSKIHGESLDGVEGTLGIGDSGLVYPLKVLSITSMSESSSAHQNLVDSIPVPELCIKLALPRYTRALAREAWFYERLDQRGLTGIVASRCYGVFHNTFPINLSSMASSNALERSSPAAINLGGGFDYSKKLKEVFRYCKRTTRRLPGDAEQFRKPQTSDPTKAQLSEDRLDDVNESFAKSEWLMKIEDRNNLSITILLLERLNHRLTSCPSYHENIDDIEAMFEDLSAFPIKHNSERFAHVMEAPETALKFCPKHRRRHKWFLVGWERADKAYQPADLSYWNSGSQCLQRNHDQDWAFQHPNLNDHSDYSDTEVEGAGNDPTTSDGTAEVLGDRCDDLNQSFATSQWATSMVVRGTLSITVLLLERLGQEISTCSTYTENIDDIYEVFEHLSSIAVRHGGVGFRKLLSVSENAQKMHGHPHKHLLVGWKFGDEAFIAHRGGRYWTSGPLELQALHDRDCEIHNPDADFDDE
ncbi:hypothetical protein CVT24_009019 [Panaeolus cyanescens]|uniref:Uncharacterized protein n=1 Tax=Panaeolus cyanescens TaxID=181874 RepID=A0A409YAM7_9AGAR|nr:hypothetical protein CVT24_009019 [Panaeolus cyanescens]